MKSRILVTLPLAANRPPLDVRDGPLFDRHQNDVALRHHGGASLSGARTGRARGAHWPCQACVRHSRGARDTDLA